MKSAALKAHRIVFTEHIDWLSCDMTYSLASKGHHCTLHVMKQSQSFHKQLAHVCLVGQSESECNPAKFDSICNQNL